MKLSPKKLILIILLLFSTCFDLFAQNKSQITGIVKDAKTQESIPFANVLLADSKTKASIKATQTDLNGAFVLTDVPNGSFTIKISYVGYQTIIKDSIVIAASHNVINLGDIKLSAAPKNMLNEVTVTAKKAVIQSSGDKKVFLVNQSLVSTGGSATELLENVPTLQIDVNGNVSLRGSTNVKVLVDGKPSSIAGGDVTQILQSIPASAVERIEVITNPSAKYDAEGNGIINIVLKKNNKQGFTGSAAVTGGTRDNCNATTSLNFQDNKVNLYSNYTYKYGNTYSNGFQNITYLDPTSPITYSNEGFPSTTLRKGNNVNAGIDYSVTDKSVLSLSGSYNNSDVSRNEFLSVDNLDADGSPVELSNRNNLTTGSGNNYDVNLNFAQKFKKANEALNFNFDYSHGVNGNSQVYNTNIYNIDGQPVSFAPDLIKNDSHVNTTNYNIQADYTLPVGKTGKIETGYRGQISLGNNYQWVYNFNNTTSTYIPVDTLTSRFNSNNQVHAIYFSYQDQIKNFSYQLGLRGEDANLSATFQSYDANGALHSTPITVANKGLYPSVLLTQHFKNEQQLQFSYNRRVNRAKPAEIDPYLDISDPVNYSTGNPELKPEDIESFDLTYKKIWDKITLNASLYYNQINNVIKHIESDPIDGVIITTPQNINNAINSGVELIGNFDLLKAWNFTTNLNIYERQNSAAPQFGVTATSGLSWNANITNNINFTKDFALQIRGDYRANDILVQDRNHAAWGIDAGAKYDFLNKRATLSLVSRDIFNTRRWAFLRESDTSLLDFERTIQSSRASLTFTYRFGSGSPEPKKQKKTDEQQNKRIDES